MNSQKQLVATILLIGAGSAHADDLTMLVCGFHSDNLVAFDLDTGAAREIWQFSDGDRPRGVAVDQDGDIYVALRGGPMVVVRLFQNGGEYKSENLTPPIGDFGPGLMWMTDDQHLLIAGGGDEVVYRFDALTETLMDEFAQASGRIIAVVAQGETAYACEIFDEQIFSADLSGIPPATILVVDDQANLFKPAGLTIGHGGGLIVSNLESPLVQEFSISTGQYAGIFIDMAVVGNKLSYDIHYVESLDRYFVTPGLGSDVYAFDSAGVHTATYTSSLLVDPYQLTVVESRLLAVCSADIVRDGDVDVSDLILVIVKWGPCEEQCPADVNGDGSVDVADLIEVVLNWGPCSGECG